MNKEQLKQNIEKMKSELAKMEAELEKSERVELDISHRWYIESNGKYEHNGWVDLRLHHKNGASRATKELAEIASKNMIARNKLEAYAMQLEPEWRDVAGRNSSYIYQHGNKFFTGLSTDHRFIGTVYMSKQTAVTICQWLNEGRITLEKE